MDGVALLVGEEGVGWLWDSVNGSALNRYIFRTGHHHRKRSK
jgi:hypothetical protein